MAVGFDTSSVNGTGSGNSSMTIDITVASNSDRLLVLFVGAGNLTNGVVSSVSGHGGTWSSVGGTDGAGTMRGSCWKCIAPNTGAATITITFTGTIDTNAEALCFSLYNVDQTTPCDNYGGRSTAGDLVINTQTGDMTVSAIVRGTDVATVTGCTTTEDQSGFVSLGFGAAHCTGSSSTTFTWATYDTPCIAQGVNVNTLAATCALSGTVTSSITEADIVAGGKTVIATMTNDTFVPANGTPTFSTATTKGTLAADSAGGGGGRTGNGTLTCTFPSGYTPTAGDFALMIVYSDQGSGSTPTDWSAVTGSPFGAGTEKLDIFYKVLVGGESAPVTTISGSGTNISHCANMAIYTGVGSIGAIGSPSNGTGTPMTAEAITTTANNSIVCACSGRGDNEAASGQTFNGSATGVNERCDGGTGAGSDSEVSMADLTVATSGTSTGQASSTTSATDPWVSVIIELLPTTPFADQRAAIRNGLDSAQAESGGWDAKVKGNIPVANVVRTSDTVCTVTLQAQSDYDITAQETITWTVPASALAGGNAVVATPTFTISPAAAVSVSSWHPSVYLPQKRSEIIVL